jgi:tetratricopeptide (TPR) repeat protein
VSRYSAILAAGICLAVGSAGWALDGIRTTDGGAPQPGEIKAIGPFEVELLVGRRSRMIPVNQIVAIYFDDEPDELTKGRDALLDGRYEDALATLGKLDPDEQKRPEIKQDIEYYTALCRAELALGGGGDILAAGRQMAAFVNTYKDSYHWLKANEILGDLYLANGDYKFAEDSYARLSQAPWPDYKMRAGVAVGGARLAQDKTAEALESFEGVLAIDATGELADLQRLAATLGRARCLTAEKQYHEAIETINGVILAVDPEQVELCAQAYNALGTALRESGEIKQARMAFLHVDVLYFAVPQMHAEALANLAELWEESNMTERAARARRILKTRYKNSPWAE